MVHSISRAHYEKCRNTHPSRAVARREYRPWRTTKRWLATMDGGDVLKFIEAAHPCGAAAGRGAVSGPHERESLCCGGALPGARLG